MYPFILIALVQVSLLNKNVVAQSGPPKCVPVGYCFPQSLEINPRIVTPGEEGPSANSTEECQAGYELCYPLQTNFECGTRYSSDISAADGPTTRGAHPWQVYIMNETSYIGSGVLLSDRIVLTAAHKVHTNKENIKIYIGVNNPTGIAIPPAAYSKASAIEIHDAFKVDANNKPEDYKDDIALVMLEDSQPMGYRTDVGLGCLPSDGDSFVNANNCIVGGWGETQFQTRDEGKVHKQVTVPIVSMETCKTSMLQPTVLGVAGTAKYLDEENELCAGGQAQKDACTQDGGAPLMCPHPVTGKYIIAGLVIWGKGCGQAGVYGVYVDVSKYLDWIQTTMTAMMEN